MLPYPHSLSRKEMSMNRTRIKRLYYASAAAAFALAGLAVLFLPAYLYHG